MLIRAWKRQLDPQATIYLSSLVRAALSFDCAFFFVEAHELRVSSAFGASVFLPEQVLKPALLKLKNLDI